MGDDRERGIDTIKNCELGAVGLLISLGLCAWQISQIIINSNLIIVEAPEDSVSLLFTNSILQDPVAEPVGLVQTRLYLLPAFQEHFAEQPEGVRGGLGVSGLLPPFVVGLRQVWIVAFSPHWF